MGRGGEGISMSGAEFQIWGFKIINDFSSFQPHLLRHFSVLWWVLRSVTNGKMSCFSNFLTVSLEFSFLGFIPSITFVYLLFTALVLLVSGWISLFKNPPFSHFSKVWGVDKGKKMCGWGRVVLVTAVNLPFLNSTFCSRALSLSFLICKIKIIILIF